MKIKQKKEKIKGKIEKRKNEKGLSTVHFYAGEVRVLKAKMTKIATL